MRKFVLMALAGAAIAFAAPQFASAMPIAIGSGINAAADTVSSTEQVRHRHWHHRHHWRHYGWRHRHWRHHRWHHRHWRRW
jgi:hypothetical protein